jgi:hypothetical protein
VPVSPIDARSRPRNTGVDRLRMLRPAPSLLLADVVLATVLIFMPGQTAQARDGVSVSIRVLGQGAVETVDGSLVCERRCTVAYRRGKRLALVARSSSQEFAFDHWAGGCVGAAERCPAILDEPLHVTATFQRLRGGIKLLVGGRGDISSEPPGIACGVSGGQCEAEFGLGATIQLIATPAPGAEFYGWGDGCQRTRPTSCRLTVGYWSELSATFRTSARPAVSQSLNVVNPGIAHVTSDPPAINCRPDCSASFAPNAVVRLLGRGVTRWQDGCVGLGSLCTLVLDSPTDVTVESPLEQQPPPPPPQSKRSYGLEVSVSIPGYGVVTGGGIRCGAPSSRASDCRRLFRYRARVTLRASAKARRRFEGWSGFCVGTKLTCEVPMTVNKWVAARFGSRRGRE